MTSARVRPARGPRSGGRRSTATASGLAAAGLAAVVALAGCGGPADEVAAPPPPGSSSPGPTTVPTSAPRSSPPVPAPPGVTPAPWCSVDRAVRELPDRRKVAQLLTVGVASVDDARWAVHEQGVGGVFVGSDAVTRLLGPRAIDSVVAGADLPVTVAIDEEGGRVDRLDVLEPPLPSPREMARTMTPRQVTDLARDLGGRLRGYGVTVDFAPSVDVSDQPDGAVIGDRSFSADPAVATTYGRAFAEGLLAAGVTPVYKHFPGHGHSSGDSHLGTVRVPPLDATRDLEPFRALVGSPGVPVMVGHMQVPGLTGDTPASLSPAAYSALRDGHLGTPPYDGVVYTDDLSGMRAITDSRPLPAAVLEALRAGADSPLFISTAELSAVLDTVTGAVGRGEYPRTQLDASLRRVLVSRGCAA